MPAKKKAAKPRKSKARVPQPETTGSVKIPKPKGRAIATAAARKNDIGAILGSGNKITPGSTGKTLQRNISNEKYLQNEGGPTTTKRFTDKELREAQRRLNSSVSRVNKRKKKSK